MKAAQVFRILAALQALALAILLFQAPLRDALAELRADALTEDGDPNAFMVQIVSDPSGATITIDGRDRGATPFIGNVPCRVDQKVTIEIAKPGHKTWRREVECRHGGSLRVSARLE
jgi:hypothetical protein